MAGITRSEEKAETYSGLEFQHLVTKLNVKQPENLTENQVVDETDFEPVGGLAHNEVAELVHLVRYNTLHMSATDVVLDDPVGCEAEIALGIDMAGDEWPQSGSPVKQIDPDSDGTDEAGLANSSTIEQGLLDMNFLSVGMAWEDETNGTGGGASPLHGERETNFRRNYGRGPVVSVTDDLVVRNEVQFEDMDGHEIEASSGWTLAWDVFEVGDRGRFGPP